MKQFKIIDCYISIALLLLFTVLLLVKQDGYFSDTLLVGFFVIGGWQGISMLVHTFARSFQQSAARSLYQLISLTAVVTLPFGTCWIMPIIAPFMAFFYTGLCYHETFHRIRRPLSYIK